MAIQIKGLKKKFGRIEAVRGLDLSVPTGSICGFLGRNGAGKTTTLKMLQGMIRPDSGEATVLGYRIDKPDESVAMRRRTAFVCEEKGTFSYMNVGQVIRVTRALYPLWSDEIAARLLATFELPSNRRVGDLSKGGQTKLALLLALSRGAEVLILDEPTEGLDPTAIEEFLQALVVMAAESQTTVFFSSHQLSEVEQIADRVVIIEKGRTVVEDSLDDLKTNYRRIRAVFDAEVPVISGARVIGRVASLLVRGDSQQVLEQVRMLRPSAIDVEPVALKEIFFDCVKGDRL
jgi:ABC-2 type transport system ATP-binding protein